MYRYISKATIFYLALIIRWDEVNIGEYLLRQSRNNFTNIIRQVNIRETEKTIVYTFTGYK
jgi:hypothetical protein